MKALYKIPLTNSPNQTFRVTVPVNNENKTFTIKLNYNDQAKYWNFSLYDTFAEQPILVNVPLLSSQYAFANILRQQSYLRIGSIYVAPFQLTNNCAPDDEDLGTNYLLIWADNEMSEFEDG